VRHSTVGEVARQITSRTGTAVPPHLITCLFYKRLLDDEQCPIVGRCRLIPPSYVPTIELVLRARGILPPVEATPCR
jgi:hypothetical protein